MLAQRLMWIAWPAFLVAAGLEMLVFALVDPEQLHGFGGTDIGMSRQAIYTASFFVFWAAAMLSSGLTTLLSMSPFEVNRCPVPPSERPPDCTRATQCQPGGPGKCG